VAPELFAQGSDGLAVLRSSSGEQTEGPIVVPAGLESAVDSAVFGYACDGHRDVAGITRPLGCRASYVKEWI